MTKENCKHGLFYSLLYVDSENTKSLLLTKKNSGMHYWHNSALTNISIFNWKGGFLSLSVVFSSWIIFIAFKCEFFSIRHHFRVFKTLTFLTVLKISMVHIGEYTFRIKFVFFLKLSLELILVMMSWWFFIINFEQFSDFAVVLIFLTLNK